MYVYIYIQYIYICMYVCMYVCIYTMYIYKLIQYIWCMCMYNSICMTHECMYIGGISWFWKMRGILLELKNSSFWLKLWWQRRWPRWWRAGTTEWNLKFLFLQLLLLLLLIGSMPPSLTLVSRCCWLFLLRLRSKLSEVSFSVFPWSFPLYYVSFLLATWMDGWCQLFCKTFCHEIHGERMKDINVW